MKKKITLSLVIPVYNEEQRLYKTVQALSQKFSFSHLKLSEVIFVNDGSTDSTQLQLEVVKPELAKILKTHIRIISYPLNKGKGFAVKTGMMAAKADYALILDADISTALSELKKCELYMTQKTSVIIGTRKNGQATIHVQQPLHRQLLGKGFTFLSQLLLNTWVSDFTCGFKLFERTARKIIFSDSQISRWGYDAEVLFLARSYGYAIQELAVEWNDEKGSRVHILVDIWGSLKELVQIRFNSFQGKYHFTHRFNFRQHIAEALS